MAPSPIPVRKALVANAVGWAEQILQYVQPQFLKPFAPVSPDY